MTTEQENTLANLGEWHNTTPQVTEHPSDVIIARFVKPGNTFEYVVYRNGQFTTIIDQGDDALLDEWIDRFERKQAMTADS